MTSPDQPFTPGQPGDPALFAPLTSDENHLLSAHLTSGWYKQDAVYTALSEPWQETAGLLDDLTAAWWRSRDTATGQAGLAEPEPEAGR